MRALLEFLKDESGTTAVEYAVMLALIIITAISGIAAFGNAVNYMWNDLISRGIG